jgi:hypothetical protein
MRCGKIMCAVALVALACGSGIVWGFPLFNGVPEEGGRLLSDREMASTFGDAGANNLCKDTKDCSCTRLGSNCIKCDNAANGGSGVAWILCCPAMGDTCNENGAATCVALFVHVPNNLGWTTQASCCTPCVPVGAWVRLTTNCTAIRKNAAGDAC